MSQQDTVSSSTTAFELYLEVRNSIRSYRDMATPADAFTQPERRMLSALDAMWDASPSIVSLLRQHCHPISGVCASDYHDPKRSLRARLDDEVARLLEHGDRALWIGEPAALGGFGIDALGTLYNEDTLRFFRVILLLRDAAVLKEFTGPGPRRTVWEIGGWGGFAYQFKTLCPHTTYVITGASELLLFSAVYLMTLFPSARFRFYDRGCPDAFWTDWDAIDFAFAPESVGLEMQAPRLDLAVDLMTLERMTTSRIAAHVQRAHDLGSRYFVSMCPSGNPDAALASPVIPSLDRYYWPHPISTSRYLAGALAARPREKDPVPRTYFLGWRRLRT